MAIETDAQELFRIVTGIVRGGAPTPAGVFGPYGADRGIREELQKQVGEVAGKINANELSKSDAEAFMAICNVAEANNVLSQTDLGSIQAIIDRNIK